MDIPLRENKTYEERLMEIPTHNDNTLTYRQVLFIDNFLIMNNAKAAYKMAYPDASDERCSTGATQLLKNKKIAAEIQRRREEVHKSAIMDANEVLGLLTKIARGEVLDQFGLDASLKDRLAAVKELKSILIDLPAKQA